MDTTNFKKVREVFDFILVTNNGKYGLVDKQGNVLVPCFMDVFTFTPDFDYCYFEKDGLRGAYCKELGYVAPVYDEIVNEAGRIEVLFQGTPGYLTDALTFVPAKLDTELNKPISSIKEDNLRSIEELGFKDAHPNSETREFVRKDEMDLTIVHEDGDYLIHLFGGHWKE